MESEEYDKRRSSTEDDRSTDLTSVSDDAAEPKSPTARAKPRVGRRVTSAQPAIRREEIPGTVQLALDKLAVPNRDRDCIGVLCDWKHQAPIHLKAVHFHKLSRALTARPNIMNLSLQGHGLADDASVEALADLVLQREIKQLDLSFCRIGDHNAAKLFELIALGKVEWLDMTYNILGVSSIPKIAQSISTSVCHLKVLSVRYNPITAVGLGTLVRYGTTLLTLDARCCGILTEENVEYRRKGFNTILKSIAANRTLNRMLVQGNGFTAGEEVLIIKAIESSDSAMTEESCLVSDPSVDPLLKSLKALNIGMRKHNEAQLEDVLNAKLDEKGFFSRTALPRLTFTPEETVAHFENIAELEEPVPDSPLVGYETPTMDIERRDTMPLGWRGSQSDGSARSFNSMTDLISLDQSNSFSRDIKRVSSVATLSMSVSSNSLRQKTACRRFLRRFNSESDDISVARLDTMPLDSIRTHNRSTWGLLGSIMKTMADTPRGVHQRKLSVNSSSAEMMAEASKFVNYKEITKQRRTSVDLPSPPTSMLTTSPEAHKTAAKKRPLTTPDAKDPSNPATPPPAVGGGPAEKPGGRSQAAAPGGAKPALDQNRKTQASRLGRSGNGVAAAAPVVVPKKAAGGAAQAQQPAKKPAAKAAAAPRAEDPGDEPTGLRLTATTLESLAENGSFSRTFDSTFNNNRNSVDDALDHQFFNATAQKKFAEADGSSGVQPAGGADAALPFPGSAATRRKSSFNEDAFFAKTGIHGPMDDDDDDNEFSGVNALFAPVPMLLDDVEQQFAGGAPMSFSGATHGSQGRSNSLSDALVSFVFPFDGSVGPAAAEEADSKDTNASTATDDADPDPKPSAEGRGVAADGGSPPGASITPFLQDIEEPAAGTGRKTTEPLIPFTLSGDDAHAFPRTKTAPQEEAVAVGSRDAANDNNSTASSNLRFRAKDTWGSDCGDSVLKVETASSASSSPTNSTKKQEKNAGSGNNNNNNNNNNSSSGKAAERGGRAAARAKGTAAAGPASPRGRSQGGRQDAQGRGKDGGGGRAGSSSSSHRNNNNNNNNNNHHHPSNHNNNNNNNNNSSGSPGGKNNGKDVSDSNNNDDSNDNNNNSGRRARSSSSHRSHKGRPPVSPRGAGGGGRKGKNEAESASESPANDAVEIRRVDSFELMSPRSEIGTPKCPPLDLPLHGLDKLPKKLPSCQAPLKRTPRGHDRSPPATARAPRSESVGKDAAAKAAPSTSRHPAGNKNRSSSTPVRPHTGGRRGRPDRAEPPSESSTPCATPGESALVREPSSGGNGPSPVIVKKQDSARFDTRPPRRPPSPALADATRQPSGKSLTKSQSTISRQVSRQASNASNGLTRGRQAERSPPASPDPPQDAPTHPPPHLRLTITSNGQVRKPADLSPLQPTHSPTSYDAPPVPAALPKTRVPASYKPAAAGASPKDWPSATSGSFFLPRDGKKVRLPVAALSVTQSSAAKRISLTSVNTPRVAAGTKEWAANPSLWPERNHTARSSSQGAQPSCRSSPGTLDLTVPPSSTATAPALGSKADVDLSPRPLLLAANLHLSSGAVTARTEVSPFVGALRNHSSEGLTRRSASATPATPARLSSSSPGDAPGSSGTGQIAAYRHGSSGKSAKSNLSFRSAEDPILALGGRGTSSTSTFLLLEAAIEADATALCILGHHAFNGLLTNAGHQQGVPELLRPVCGLPSSIKALSENSPVFVSSLAKLLFMIIDPAADAHASTAADRAIKRAVFRKQNNACFVRKLDCKVALAVLKQVRWSRRPRKNSKVQPRRRSPSPGMLNSARTPPDSALHALHHPREPLSLALHRPPSTAAATSAAAALAAQPSNSGPLLSNYRPLMTPDSPLGNAAKMRILRSPSSGRGSRTPR